MKMNKNYLILSIFIFLVIGGYLLYSKKSDYIIENSDEIASKKINKEQIKVEHDGKESAKYSKPKEVVQPDVVTNSREYIAKKMQSFDFIDEANANDLVDFLEFSEQRAKKENIDLVFYGRVVNQSGSPVANASVTGRVFGRNENVLRDLEKAIEINTKASPLKSSEFEVFTDQNGIFEVSGYRATSMVLHNIKKDGIFFDISDSEDFVKKDTSIPKSREYLDDYNSVNRAYEFNVWEFSDHLPKLAHAKNIYKSIKFYKGEERKSFNLDQYFSEEINADIRITARTDRTKNRREYFWNTEVFSNDLKMQLSDNKWGFIAPERGYSSNRLILGKKAGEVNWSHDILGKTVFFKYKDKFYGKFVLDIKTFGDTDVAIYINDLVINMSGGRSLEYVPK